MNNNTLVETLKKSYSDSLYLINDEKDNIKIKNNISTRIRHTYSDLLVYKQ